MNNVATRQLPPLHPHLHPCPLAGVWLHSNSTEKNISCCYTHFCVMLWVVTIWSLAILAAEVVALPSLTSRIPNPRHLGYRAFREEKPEDLKELRAFYMKIETPDFWPRTSNSHYVWMYLLRSCTISESIHTQSTSTKLEMHVVNASKIWWDRWNLTYFIFRLLLYRILISFLKPNFLVSIKSKEAYKIQNDSFTNILLSGNVD